MAPRAVAADPKAGVIVTSVGPSTLRLRVAEGNVQPCSSSSNKQLYDGMLESGKQLELKTTQMCVCVEHTHGTFSRTDWGPPVTWCRPRVCDATRTQCRGTDDPTIRVTVTSAERVP